MPDVKDGDPFADVLGQREFEIDEAFRRTEAELQRRGVEDAGAILAEFMKTVVPHWGHVSKMVDDRQAPGVAKARVREAEAYANPRK